MAKSKDKTHDDIQRELIARVVWECIDGVPDSAAEAFQAGAVQAIKDMGDIVAIGIYKRDHTILRKGAAKAKIEFRWSGTLEILFNEDYTIQVKRDKQKWKTREDGD